MHGSHEECCDTIVSHLAVGITSVEPGDGDTITTRSDVPSGEWVEVLDIEG